MLVTTPDEENIAGEVLEPLVYKSDVLHFDVTVPSGPLERLSNVLK